VDFKRSASGYSYRKERSITRDPRRCGDKGTEAAAKALRAVINVPGFDDMVIQFNEINNNDLMTNSLYQLKTDEFSELQKRLEQEEKDKKEETAKKLSR
jgi:hypothetical protein